MKRTIPAVAALLLAALFIGCTQDQKPEQPAPVPEKKDSPVTGSETTPIEMKTVKLRELLDTHIAGQKGKVVVLDLWGYFCGPCKEHFHNLVRLHHTYNDKGVVCMSLSLDYRESDKAKAPGFLKEKKAVFANYWLEEGFSAAQEHWDFQAVSVVVVYGRDGKIAKAFKADDGDVSYDDVEKLVKKLL